MAFNSKFETPKVTVDIVVFTIVDKKLKTLLVRRKYPPFQDIWALPGGFIRKHEELPHAALRELKEETGVSKAYLEQLYTFGEEKRDPRGRIITIAYFALVPKGHIRLKASHDAKEARLFSLKELPRLAFDHKKIIGYGLTRVRTKMQYTNTAWSLLPEKFTLREIQEVYEKIWGKHADKRNFRKKIISLGLIEAVKGVQRGLKQRPAKLYSFKTKKYVELRRFF